MERLGDSGRGPLSPIGVQVLPVQMQDVRALNQKDAQRLRASIELHPGRRVSQCGKRSNHFIAFRQSHTSPSPTTPNPTTAAIEIPTLVGATPLEERLF